MPSTSSMKNFIVLIQARMSSSRFPGKVLAPFLGKPIIAHLLHRVEQVLPRKNILLLTSNDKSDDPLATYVSEKLFFTTYRGNLNNVVSRYQDFLATTQHEWFVRLCGDSPILDQNFLLWMMEHASKNKNFDIMSNVFKRTFPKGQSIEIISKDSFCKISSNSLTNDEKEHVTLSIYNNPTRYKILSVEHLNPSPLNINYSIDTIHDLKRLERSLSENPSFATNFSQYAKIVDVPY